MSKKNKHRQVEGGQVAVAGFDQEYIVIRHDLLRVIALNVIYLVGILALYYTNEKTQYLEHWFTQVFGW